MPANIPGIATKVPQSKLYIGLFSDHRVHIDVKQYGPPISDSMGRCSGGRGGLVSLIMHEEPRL